MRRGRANAAEEEVAMVDMVPLKSVVQNDAWGEVGLGTVTWPHDVHGPVRLSHQYG